MTVERKQILATSLAKFLFEIQEAIHDGWEIDPDHYPDVWGFSYETGMIKDVSKARKRAEDFLAGVGPKKDRAAILADARAAKAAKKASDNGN